ncbi:hypothetical protein JB92DRAFT_3096924, partial [Gautieria morchelliformis]
MTPSTQHHQTQLRHRHRKSKTLELGPVSPSPQGIPRTKSEAWVRSRNSSNSSLQHLDINQPSPIYSNGYNPESDSALSTPRSWESSNVTTPSNSMQTQNVAEPSLPKPERGTTTDSQEQAGSTHVIGAGGPSTPQLQSRKSSIYLTDTNTAVSTYPDGRYPGPVYPVHSARGDWKPYVHHNGLPYFANKKARTVTYENIDDQNVSEKVETYVEAISKAVSRSFHGPKDQELVIQLGKKGSKDHFVLLDHARRRTMTLPSDSSKWTETLLSDSSEFDDDEHVYWEQVCKFPMHRPLSPGAEDEVMSALAFYYTERIDDNAKTTSPFSRVQCEHFIFLYKTLKNVMAREHGVRTWFVSYVMISIWQSRKAYKYGKIDAIPRIEEAEEDSPNMKQKLFNIFMFIICFGTHERYRDQLKFARANGGLYVPAFQKSLQDMLQEWTESNLLGTVLVSASVAFLSVQQIQKTQQSMALVSTFCSMASILTGVHHLWKHRSQTRPILQDTQRPIIRVNGERRYSQSIRMTLSAGFLSCPLAFLMWSVISFSLALLHFAFQHIQGPARALLACIVAVILFTVLCVYIFFYKVWGSESVLTR